VSSEELREIERLVNAWVGEAIPVETVEMAYDEAVKTGAVALFGEKYGERVRVVRIGEVSKELCGGTHLANTAQIRYFRIISEGGVATGVRRIEAVTNDAALSLVEKERAILDETAAILKAEREAIPGRVAALLEELEGLRRAAAEAEREAAGSKIEEIPIHVLPGGKYAVGRLDGFSMELLREAADKLRERMQSGVAVLGGVIDGKPLFVVGVTKDLIAKVKAGDLIKAIAAVAGGSGGGRSDFAQAGGKDAGKLDEALGKGVDLIREALG